VKTTVYAMIICVVLFSCNKEKSPDCFQKAGNNTTIKRSIEEFDAIELRDLIDIELVDSTAYFVEISGPQNLLPEIETTVTGGKLHIQNNNSCNFVRSFKNKIKVRIYAPEFPEIQNYSTGNIKSKGRITCNSFKLENRNAAGQIELDVSVDSMTVATHTGVCDVIVRGESHITTLFNQGVGKIDARGLITQDAFVNNSSINDVYVNTNGYFFALIEFSGNIFYSGTPNHIDQDIKGDGRLVPIAL